MKQIVMAAVLWTLCSLASSCGPEVVPLNVKASHPDRFICERADGDPAADIRRPAIPPEYAIDWEAQLVPGDARQTLQNAMGQVALLLASIRTRENVTVGYIVRIEGANFTCWDNMVWQRQFYDGM